MPAEEMKWWAGSKDIRRMGPYPTQVAAWASLRAADVTQAEKANAARDGRPEPQQRVHVPGAYVWSE